MKKIIDNISDSTYEKIRFEAIKQKKSISQIISERIMHKKFDDEVQECFDEWINQEITKIMEY
jgi:hypothetical protein